MALTDAQKGSIANLYIGYFGRAADPDGLNYWYGRLGSGEMTLLDIANSFAVQPEAKAQYSYLNAPNLQFGITSFINSIYQNLFNRDADTTGLTYWTNQLLAGKLAGRLIVDVISGATGGDITILANKGIVATSYVTALLTAGVAVSLTDAATVLRNVTAVAGTVAAGTALSNQLVAAAAAIGTTYTLTAGIDTVVGTAKNDTITSTVTGALSAFDSIDGGAGIDTLNVSDTAALNVSSQVSIINVEIANLVSASTVTVDTTNWTGLTKLNVTGSGANTLTAAGTTAVTLAATNVGTNNTTSVQGGNDVSVTMTGGQAAANVTIGTVTAPTGAITLSTTSTGAVAMGAVNVVGGTTGTITQAASNAVNTTTTMGSVSVTGKAGTTAVTVINAAAAAASATVAGVNDNTVSITDVNNGSTTAAGSITTVAISNYTTASINDNALTNLSLTGGSGNVTIGNSGLTAPTNRTLGLTVSGLTGGTLSDANAYTTMNVITAGAASILAGISDTALSSLTLAGTKSLTLTSAAGMSALQTVTVSGAAGLTADLSGLTTLTAIDTSGTNGTSTLTFDASKATFTGGAGIDKVTTTATVTKAISLGAGNDSLVLSGNSAPTATISGGLGTDSLTMSATLAATASGSVAFAGLVSGFEQLVLTGATNQTVDLAVLGITGQVTTSGGNGLTLSNLINGGTLALTGAGTAYTISNSAFTSGANDTINLALTDGSGASVAFATTGITASGVENLAITTADTQATPTGSFNDSVTLLGNSAKSILVSGNAGLTLTATDIAATTIDASGISLGGFTYTSGALVNAATIKGSAAGTNTIDFSAASGTVTYSGGGGNDAIIGNGRNNVTTLGNGTNSFSGGNGNNTVTSGGGNDTVTLGSGNSTVSLGNGVNSFTATSGNNTYTGGAGIDTVTLGGGSNTITLGAGANVFAQTAANTNVNTYTTITDAITGDSINFANQGIETFNSSAVHLAVTAVFQDYANAVIASGGDASTNGAFGWFQYSGDTYVVESHHNGASTPSFLNGTDYIVKLSGTIDLSTATNSGTQVITLN